jgi:hypothetical protein
MKSYKLSEDVLQATVQYLSTKPYNETFQLIGAIQQQIKPQVEASQEVKPNDNNQ